MRNIPQGRSRESRPFLLQFSAILPFVVGMFLFVEQIRTLEMSPDVLTLVPGTFRCQNTPREVLLLFTTHVKN